MNTLTPSEVMAILKVNRRSLKRLVDSGLLKVSFLSKRNWRTSEEAIRNFLPKVTQ